MKHVCIFFSICALLVFMSPVSYGQNISGTAHDFSGETFSGGRICVVCHTPHNGNTTEPNAPLWNHALTTATFTPYNTVSLNATVGQPNQSSKLCLSCHDGTVAIDAFGSNTGSEYITGNADLGTNLSNDHPVSFTYDAALASADGELFDPSTVSSGLGGTIEEDLLFGGQLQCASCHDVHNAGFGELLRKSNAASALCLTCHNK